MDELIARALDTAQAQGAQYADVRLVRQERQLVLVRNGTVEEVSLGEDAGFGVRALVDGAWGFASSYRTDPAEADAVAGEAVRIARASARVHLRPVQLGEPVRSRGTYRTPVAVDPFAVPLDEKIALLLRADGAMRLVPQITATTAQLICIRDRKTFASTEGAQTEQEIVQTGGGITATAAGEGEVQRRSYPNSGGRNQVCEGYEFVQRIDLEANAPRVAEEAVALLTARQCPPGVTTVILDGSQLALQVHESCGHPIELDRVFGSEAAYAGTSFLTTDKLGTFRYGSEAVTMTADATLPGALGTFGWDDEGVPAQRVEVVKEGRFVGYLTDRENASRLSLPRSMGAARASGWNRIPLVRMTNVSLEPGTWALGDLVADTDDGLYLETNRSWSIDDRRLNFQFGTEVAYEIKGGKRGALLKNATYTGITPRFWGNCDAICDQDHWVAWGTPNCGKGQPSQTMHTGHGAAPARFRNVQVGVAR
ncbi:MAG TPA: TldD/PmbA family protein [Chloroflexota bacterium]|nr:TldD/PmbA family protein [Chloroflexota bacterium]